MFVLGCIVGGVVCGAIVWFGKEQIQKIILGAPAVAASLEAKAAAIRAALK